MSEVLRTDSLVRCPNFYEFLLDTEGALIIDKLAFEAGPEHVYIILKLLVAVLEDV